MKKKNFSFFFLHTQSREITKTFSLKKGHFCKGKVVFVSRFPNPLQNPLHVFALVAQGLVLSNK